ncbi:putative reverse transcriptase domain-containing protein [Tanacetum coccineum]
MITNNNNRTRDRTQARLILQGLSWPSCRTLESLPNTNASNNQRGTRAGQKPTCYECGAQGHFKRDCPKLKNNNRGNQGGNGNASAKLQIDITPSTLDHYYDVELADGRIIGLNTIIQGCTLNFLNHPFNIDLMPVELGSVDVIVGMDWLAKYQAVIIYAEKIIRIPWGNETLIVRGDRSDRGNETRLNIISCTKTQKYMLKGCPIFFGTCLLQKRLKTSREEAT